MKNKVFAYRNLNRKGVVWSIKDCKTNLVIDRVGEAYFKDVELKVSQAGRERVLREERKNVHAGVKGIRLKRHPKGVFERAYYDPYKTDSFIDWHGLSVISAAYAVLNSEGLWIQRKPSEEV